MIESMERQYNKLYNEKQVSVPLVTMGVDNPMKIFPKAYLDKGKQFNINYEEEQAMAEE